MHGWQSLDSVRTDDGLVELVQRGPGDFQIRLDGRILMSSRASRSEEALGAWVAEAIAGTQRPCLLVAGLGMGFTLRAALDTLPGSAAVWVAELEPRVVAWCRGPLRALCGDVLADPRVELALSDVAELIGSADGRFDGIALDLYEGVRIPSGGPASDPCYGDAALARAHRALRGGGVFARWCEQPDPGFERRLARAGFEVEARRAGRGGRRHTLYLARRS